MNYLSVNFITMQLVIAQQIFLARYFLVQKMPIPAKNYIDTIFFYICMGAQGDKEFMISVQLFSLV